MRDKITRQQFGQRLRDAIASEDVSPPDAPKEFDLPDTPQVVAAVDGVRKDPVRNSFGACEENAWDSVPKGMRA